MQSELVVASWNVNSIRSRLAHVLRWLENNNVSVLALQETKVIDELFPSEAFIKNNWHVSFCGQKSYNGVAFITREPPISVSRLTDFGFPTNLKGDLEARAIEITTSQQVSILNIYAVNGEALDSPKFNYKLSWFSALKNYLARTNAPSKKYLIVGDFNIAPSDLDVYDKEIWKNRVHVSTEERSALAEIIEIGFHDTFRHLYPNQEQSYTWWDYRTFAFDKNHGLRIDLSLASQSLLAKIKDVSIDKAPRAWEKASDHTPLVTTIG
ncbi:MAG: exodeoxyribonuclease III [Methylacidiphilales bacterium]|nr:exodeoxyribonuclease III [Candidatus Methylacidiphilales bacterium]